MSGAASATAIAGSAAAGTAAAGAAAASATTIAGFSLSSIATAASLVGAGISAIGSIQQGKAAASSAKFNAALSENNAKIAQQNATLAGQEGAANTAIEQQKTRAGVAEIKASQAARGIDVNNGSAVDVRSSAAELGELNAITVRSNAVRQAYGYQTQAASDAAQSQLDKSESAYDSEAGYISAGSTLLSDTGSALNNGLWGKQLKNGALNGN